MFQTDEFDLFKAFDYVELKYSFIARYLKLVSPSRHSKADKELGR